MPELLVDLGVRVLPRRVEQVLEVLQVDLAILVCVNDLERLANVLLLYESLPVEARGHEVLEVDLAVAVHVALLYYL